MNERIKELAQQAEIYAGDLIDQGADYDQYPRYYTEKLTELMVRECYVALFPALRDMISRGQAYDMIRQHFGVEE